MSSWVSAGQLGLQELKEAFPVQPGKVGGERRLLRAGPGPLSGRPEKAHEVSPVEFGSPLRAVQVWTRSLSLPAPGGGCFRPLGFQELCWAYPGVLWGALRPVSTGNLLQASPASLSWPVRGLPQPITGGLLPGLCLPPVAGGATQLPPALLGLPERAPRSSLWGSGNPPSGLPQAWAFLPAAVPSLQMSVRALGSWSPLLTLPPPQRLSWAHPATFQWSLCPPLPLRGPG